MPRRGQRVGVEKRFWRYVAKGQPVDSCWLWAGARQPKGYGTLNVEGKSVKAHRLSYELHHGPIPKGLHVLHRCDNPPCVNPAHLWAGTNMENIADKMAKGREPNLKGEKHPLAMLTEADVKQIRALHAAGGLNYAQIGARFGVEKHVVGMVIRRETWRHVE